MGFFGGGAKPSSDPTGEQVGGLPPEDLYNSVAPLPPLYLRHCSIVRCLGCGFSIRFV